ncbi:mCG144851, partial [Mus musculus]
WESVAVIEAGAQGAYLLGRSHHLLGHQGSRLVLNLRPGCLCTAHHPTNSLNTHSFSCPPLIYCLIVSNTHGDEDDTSSHY